MRWSGFLVLGGAVWIGGCSWIPFIGSSDGPQLTNPAVEACRDKAEDLGYEDVGERQSSPTAGGGYTVQLDIRENEGFGQVTCTYDPAKGADLPPPKPPQKPAEKPPEKPAEKPAETAPEPSPAK